MCLHSKFQPLTPCHGPERAPRLTDPENRERQNFSVCLRLNKNFLWAASNNLCVSRIDTALQEGGESEA